MEKVTPALASVRKGVGRGLAFLGAGAVVSSLALAAARYQALKADRQLPDEFVLEVDLERLELTEALPSGPLAPLELLRGGANRKVELRRAVAALERAGKDGRVRGLLGHLGRRESLGGLAMVQELRGGLSAFRQAVDARPKGAAGAVSVAYAPSFGEAGSNGTLQYYLASAFDRVVMQPTGTLGLLGLQSQTLFLRDALDKAKVSPVFFTREDYKTAAHMFTQRAYTPQHRDNTLALLQDMAGQMWAGIASSRGVPLDQVQRAVAAAPLPAPLAAGIGASGTLSVPLLDGLQYKDEVIASFQKSEQLLAKQRKEAAAALTASGAAAPPAKSSGASSSAGSKPAAWSLPPPEHEGGVDPRLPRVPLTKYMLVSELAEAAKAQGSGAAGWLASTPWRGLLPASWLEGGGDAAGAGAGPTGTGAVGGAVTAESAGWVPKALGRGKPKVAVVHCVGAIVQGPVSPGESPPGQQVIDASRLAAELERLGDARDVAAVVVRVSSPGGSALGSDTLHRALSRLRARGKAVVISCGDVAASGGMFMAVAGDRILAQPGTITGSIGVITGKFNVRALLEDYGVNPASLEAGSPNLDLLSPFTHPNEQQVATINTLMDNIYNDFLGKVAAGRRMSAEAVRGLAGGRVYTGKQAHDVGLVDELGGLREAVAAARKLAGLPEEEDKSVVFDYPPRRVPVLVRLLRAAGSGSGGAPDANPSDVPPGSSSSTSTSLSSSPAWLEGAAAAAASALMGAALPAAPAASASPTAAAIASVAAAGSAMPGGASVRQLADAAAAVVGTVAMLDGQVAAYSAEADLLARGLM
mmetsp:Transcript_34336/g.86829  ORF Transcript_34336/g.86829 Transcript_34336/m.86829 type:complete len:813 (-) Transcript_34336:265-2703(-)